MFIMGQRGGPIRQTKMLIFFKIFFVIAMFYNPIYLLSHSGGLNSEGCHRNGKTDINPCHSEEKKKVLNIIENLINISHINQIQM